VCARARAVTAVPSRVLPVSESDDIVARPSREGSAQPASNWRLTVSSNGGNDRVKW
jgi:hypothetical protein